MECWTLHALNCHSFNYVTKGVGLSDSDYEWQNNLIYFTHYMVECIVHKHIVYKCIVYSVSFGTQFLSKGLKPEMPKSRPMGQSCTMMNFDLAHHAISQKKGGGNMPLKHIFICNLYICFNNFCFIFAFKCKKQYKWNLTKNNFKIIHLIHYSYSWI